MNARRKAAFDPSRLDDLDDVLDAPPAPPAPRAEPSPPVAAPAPMASSADVRAARGPRRLPGDALASASTRPGRASQQRAGGEDPRAVKGWSDRSGRTVAVQCRTDSANALQRRQPRFAGWSRTALLRPVGGLGVRGQSGGRCRGHPGCTPLSRVETPAGSPDGRAGCADHATHDMFNPKTASRSPGPRSRSPPCERP
jgi:hypothetical protein